MRTDVSVAGKDTLAVVLTAIPNFKYTISEIRKAIIEGQFGVTNVSKDFLLPGENERRVKRGKSSMRHRCKAIFLQTINTTTTDKLVKRKCT